MAFSARTIIRRNNPQGLKDCEYDDNKNENIGQEELQN